MQLNERHPGTGLDVQALAMNERRRARGLLETLAEAKAETVIQSEVDPQLQAQYSQLQQRINKGDALLRDASRAGNESKIAEIEEKLRSLLIERGDLEAQIRGGSSGPLQPQALTLSEMQKLVGPWSLLLVYSLGEKDSRLWSLSGDGELKSYTLPPRKTLEQAAKNLRAAWGRPRVESRAAQWAAQLSQKILAPVAADLGEKRLLIVADGALEALPFAALPDPRDLKDDPAAGEAARPLLVRNEIVHLPSISTLAALRRGRRRAAPPSWIGILADPVFSRNDPRVQGKATASGDHPAPANPDLSRAAEDFEIESFERLPFSRVEAESIAQLLPKHASRVALDFEASRDLIESQELKRYRILHFATHGLLNSKHPELSGLVLSQVDPQGHPRDDGFLLSYEISNLDLRAQLVVLSACQTGLGDEIRGEGLVSLTRSFMQAGVPKVVVSLWNVNDRATAELMTRFYRASDRKRPPAFFRLALRAALPAAQTGMELALLTGLLSSSRETGRPAAAPASLPSRSKWQQVNHRPPRTLTSRRPDRRDFLRARTWTDGFLFEEGEMSGGRIFNGVDARTGRYLRAPETEEEFVRRIHDTRLTPKQLLDYKWWIQRYAINDPKRAPAVDVDPLKLESAGWGVIFAPSISSDGRERPAAAPEATARTPRA